MTRTLRIAIDGRGLSGKRTGVGTYTANLIEQLLEVDPGMEVLLHVDGDLPRLNWLSSPRVRAIRRTLPWRNNFLWMNLALRRGLAVTRPHLLHSPGYTLPLRPPCPAVVTLHDISYAARPEWYPHPIGPFRRAWYRSAARRANHVLTVSEFSRKEILRVYGLEPERVTSVPLGVDQKHFRRVEDPGRLEDLRSRYGLAGRILLHVGDIHPRRNIGRVIQAFHSLKERGEAFADLTLVLVGRPLDPPDVLRRQSDPAGVRMLGYVPGEELPVFYSLADAFVFPSLYEGFGLGVLEAMACGCPVVTGSGTACEEVAGEAALLVDPEDARSLRSALEAVVGQPELRAELREKGIRRAALFDWRRTAERTRDIYEQVARLYSQAAEFS